MGVGSSTSSVCVCDSLSEWVCACEIVWVCLRICVCGCDCVSVCLCGYHTDVKLHLHSPIIKKTDPRIQRQLSNITYTTLERIWPDVSEGRRLEARGGGVLEPFFLLLPYSQSGILLKIGKAKWSAGSTYATNSLPSDDHKSHVIFLSEEYDRSSCVSPMLSVILAKIKLLPDGKWKVLCILLTAFCNCFQLIFLINLSSYQERMYNSLLHLYLFPSKTIFQFHCKLGLSSEYQMCRWNCSFLKWDSYEDLFVFFCVALNGLMSRCLLN